MEKYIAEARNEINQLISDLATKQEYLEKKLNGNTRRKVNVYMAEAIIGIVLSGLTTVFLFWGDFGVNEDTRIIVVISTWISCTGYFLNQYLAMKEMEPSLNKLFTAQEYVKYKMDWLGSFLVNIDAYKDKIMNMENSDFDDNFTNEDDIREIADRKLETITHINNKSDNRVIQMIVLYVSTICLGLFTTMLLWRPITSLGLFGFRQTVLDIAIPSFVVVGVCATNYFLYSNQNRQIRLHSIVCGWLGMLVGFGAFLPIGLLIYIVIKIIEAIVYGVTVALALISALIPILVIIAILAVYFWVRKTFG